MTVIPPVRPSPIAGTWYESNPQALAHTVDAFLDQAVLPAISGEVVAVITPHAGLKYSGAVAGYAFAPLKGRSFDLVAVLSPMHQPYFEPLLTSAHQAYATPLGQVSIDQTAMAELGSHLQADLAPAITPVAFDREHSLEIELPFLQRVLAAPFQLLPVMVRSNSPKVIRALGSALANTLKDRNALLVASTDLSHFYTQEQALGFDSEIMKRIGSFDIEAISQVENEQQGFACGLGAVVAVLWAARALGADSVKVLHHATSAEVSGDFGSVVGYGAAVVLRPVTTHPD